MLFAKLANVPFVWFHPSQLLTLKLPSLYSSFIFLIKKISYTEGVVPWFMRHSANI